MKFYIAHDKNDDKLGVTNTMREAKQLVSDDGAGRVDMEEIEVSGESIRLLLAGYGGYAKDYKTVWELKPTDGA